MSNNIDQFTEFPTITREEWLRAIDKDRLPTSEVPTERDQIKFSVVNTHEDLPPQNRSEPSLVASSNCVLESLVNNSLGQVAINRIVSAGANGICLPPNPPDEVFALLREQPPFDLVSGQFRETSSAHTAEYLNYFRQLPTDKKVRGTIYFAELPADDLRQAEFVRQATQQVQDLPMIRTVTVDGSIFHHRGASPIDELAMVLSQWVAYLDELTDRGWSVEEVLNRSELTLTTGTDFFPDLAKFRALRSLSRKIGQAYGLTNLTNEAPLLRAVSGKRNKSYYDQDSNLLRNTTEALAALLGGASTLSVLPHSFLHGSDEFGSRMASNVYHILREEAHVGMVYDPAAGSYFLEDLTRQLVEKSWHLFLDFEERGGFHKLSKENVLTDRCLKYAEQRADQVAKHRKIVVGATRYVNEQESVAANEESSEPESDSLRWAASYEKIRFHHDKQVAHGKPRPKLRLWVQRDAKNAALINRRANYVKDTLAATGLAYQEYAMQQVSDFSLEALEEELGSIFCGTDSFYETTVVRILEKERPVPSIRWIAGGARSVVEAVQQVGANGVLGVGHDVVSLLEQTVNHSAREA